MLQYVYKIQRTKRGKLMMLDARQGFGEEVDAVKIACDMLDPELVLLDPVPQPVKTHVDAF
jgi:hypothetical protein